MIKKTNSSDLMARFVAAENDIKSIDIKLQTIQTGFEKRAEVIKQIHEYNGSIIQQILEKIGMGSVSDTIVFADEENIAAGNFGIYGQTIHPAFAGKPNNIFNFSTSTGYIYKDIASITINNETKTSYSDILKHDSIEDQEPVFADYTSNELTMTVAIQDGSSLIDRKCNVIELCPYLPGSFTISSLVIKTQDSAATEQYSNSLGDIVLLNLERCGNMRICLPSSVNLKSVTFTIQLNYQNAQNRYPFGFKHIYFYNADYVSSSIVVPIQKQEYIDYISEDITIHSQAGTIDTTCTAQGIKAYLYYNNGTLENEITPLNGSNQSYLTRNVKKIYLKIPITTSLMSFSFKTIKTR